MQESLHVHTEISPQNFSIHRNVPKNSTSNKPRVYAHILIDGPRLTPIMEPALFTISIIGLHYAVLLCAHKFLLMKEIQCSTTFLRPTVLFFFLQNEVFNIRSMFLEHDILPAKQ